MASLARPDMALIVERDRCRELANGGNEDAEVAWNVLQWVLKTEETPPSSLVSAVRTAKAPKL